MGDFNLMLLIIVIVVCVLVFAFNTYLLINYQHPDDHNQAYFPKAVVVLGLSVAQLSILMLPADVANRHACQQSLYNGACSLTLPMKELWYAVYIIDAVLVFFVIPFTIFYYEGDQDKSVARRSIGALVWVVVTAIVIGLVLGILYGLVGKVDFTVRHLSATTIGFTSDYSGLSTRSPCLVPSNGPSGVRNVQCSAYNSGFASEATWTQRTTFPQYVVALMTIIGSILFSIFGGVGIACLPLSMIFAFFKRPTAVITRSQYIKEATVLGKRARELKDAIVALQREEKTAGRGRSWRKQKKKVEQELLYLEEDEQRLEEAYPQGEKADTAWALTVLSYLAKLILGLIGLAVSAVWVAHIIVYVLIKPPLSPFLNEAFIKLDDVFGLLGTAAFAFFSLYLMLAVMSGEMHLGLNFGVLTIHPMKYGATLMNSFLFNVGLILLCSVSVIQFCSKAFALYAKATAAQEIFGLTLESLRGIKYLFRYNVFQIIFCVLSVVTLIYYLAFGWRRKKPRKSTITS